MGSIWGIHATYEARKTERMNVIHNVVQKVEWWQIMTHWLR